MQLASALAVKWPNLASNPGLLFHLSGEEPGYKLMQLEMSLDFGT